MSDSIHHVTLKLFENCVLVEESRLCHLLPNFTMDDIKLRYQICELLVVYRYYCMALYHFQNRRYVIIIFQENAVSKILANVDYFSCNVKCPKLETITVKPCRN